MRGGLSVRRRNKNVSDRALMARHRPQSGGLSPLLIERAGNEVRQNRPRPAPGTAAARYDVRKVASLRVSTCRWVMTRIVRAELIFPASARNDLNTRFVQGPWPLDAPIDRSALRAHIRRLPRLQFRWRSRLISKWGLMVIARSTGEMETLIAGALLRSKRFRERSPHACLFSCGLFQSLVCHASPAHSGWLRSDRPSAVAE